MGEWLLVLNEMRLSFQFCWDEWSCFVVVETKFISDWVICWTFELVGWSLGLWVIEKFKFLCDNRDGGYEIKIAMRDPSGLVGYCRE
jgi:hypothetical protein